MRYTLGLIVCIAGSFLSLVSCSTSKDQPGTEQKSLSKASYQGQAPDEQLYGMAQAVLARLAGYQGVRIVTNAGSDRYIKIGEQRAEVLLIVRRPERSGDERIKFIFIEQSGKPVFSSAYLETGGDFRRISVREE